MPPADEFNKPLIDDPQGQPYSFDSPRFNQPTSIPHDATAPSPPSSGPPSPQPPPPRQPSFRPYRGSPELPPPEPYRPDRQAAAAFPDMAGNQFVASASKMSRGANLKVIGSYALDWIILIATGVVGVILGNVTPNKRYFSLADPNISFPFTEHELVPSWLLLVLNAGVPIVCIFIISLIFVPGSTVPPGTPKSLIWRRKLWELHTGWLGLALSLCSAWIITQGMKNLFGKPRPDLLARCEPDVANFAEYVVGGKATASLANGMGQLVSAAICQNQDHGKLDDGFRSYPSGHSSSAAAGLIYLTFFIASKFAITIPWLAPTVTETGHSEASAFPSRLAQQHRDAEDGFELDERSANSQQNPNAIPPATPGQHVRTVLAARRTAAAPPLYLLLIAILPTFVSVFVAGSRWPDFRHHGFDILFGWLIGLGTAIFAFRFYHLPIGRGAGWAWGPRSSDKAFWGGVGSVSYATGHTSWKNGTGVEKRRAGAAI